MSADILNSRLQGATLVVETSAGEEIYDQNFLVAALLVHVARGSGQIEAEESGQIIELLEDYFGFAGAESLELVTRALTEMDDKPSLVGLLSELAATLSHGQKEDSALMGLKVVAADGRKNAAEMQQYRDTMDAMGISPEITHRAFDRYFEQTMTDI